LVSLGNFDSSIKIEDNQEEEEIKNEDWWQTNR
jgi:hypothetical protein